MITQTEIEAFLSVCKTHSITKAAEMLYISQSSLSSRLRSLEETAGCVLLDRQRGARTIELTAEGKRFYELALQYQELMRKMRGVAGGTENGYVRVSAINSIGTFFLPAICERFLKAYPDIHLEVQDMDAEAAYQKLEAGTTDMAFTAEIHSSPRVDAFLLFTEPMAFICAAEAPYPIEVCREQLSAKDEVYVPWCEAFVNWRRVEFQGSLPLIQLEIMSQLKAFLLESPNWAIVPISIAHGLAAESKSLRQCTLTFPVPQRAVYCLCRRPLRNQRPFKQFLSCVCEELFQNTSIGWKPQIQKST